MRAAWIAALALLVAPIGAVAQTTTFNASTCGSGIAISNGGLTLGVPATGGNISWQCIANVAKYSGKWYYEFTTTQQTNNGVLTFGFGVGNNGASQPVNGGVPLSGSGAGSSTNTIVGVNAALELMNATSALLQWHGTKAPSDPAGTAVGTTGALALDLDTDPPQVWATPNVAGTGGYNGGPLWNGSTSASPLVPGTGKPMTGGTGMQIVIPGQGYFPVFADWVYNNVAGAGTFNFGASAFVGTVPSGFQAWNTAGGEAPTPGPTHPMTINVANAPAWQASHTYIRGDRVLAGPAWSGSAYTSGQPLYLWALVGGYGGASGTSPAAFNSCASPSDYGGGLLGNAPAQWQSATKVKDGALTWACLSPVDYTTFTAMSVDAATQWAPSTTYAYAAYVMNGGNVYAQYPSPAGTCVSASSGSGPTGTTLFLPVAGDGTCTWELMGTVPYSSESNRIPHEWIYFTSAEQAELQLDWDTTVNVWYGGREASVYQGGASGENDPIMLDGHMDYPGELTPYCMNGNTGNNSVQEPNCNGLDTGWMITVQPAPGDGFANNATPGVTPLGYPNSAYGAEFYSDSANQTTGAQTGPALAVGDSEVNVLGLQFLSKNSIALAMAALNLPNTPQPGSGHSNWNYLNADVFYAGGSAAAVTFDAQSIIANSTIVYAGSATNCVGVMGKFSGAIVDDTFIGPGAGATNCTAIATFEGTAIGLNPMPFYNNAIFGWANPFAYHSGGTALVGGGNVTDLASSYAPPATFNIDTNGSDEYTAAMIPGVTQYGLAASAEFVNPTLGSALDLTTRPGSAIRGAGAAFSYATNQGIAQTLTGSRDIFGNARPQGTRYDAGAYEASLGCPSIAGVGCN